jgi:hypothetical protein
MTQIKRDFGFQAGVYFEGNFLMNIYEISLSMDVDTNSIKEQNIAMDRIKYFLYEVLANSVFVQDSEKHMIEKYSQANIKVCTLPEEPYDQIIALMILLKINAITEGRLTTTDIVLKSELSDDVAFLYDIETAIINPFGKKGWWLEPNCAINNQVTHKKEKIVKLIKKTDWFAADLDWEDKVSLSNEIVFTQEPTE